MNEAIIAKLHTALYHISPLASEREKLIAKLGEVIWLETLEEVILAVPEEQRGQLIEALNEEDVNKAMEIALDAEVPVEEIMMKVSNRVITEEIE